MSRQLFLDLAAQRHRVPMATDLVLREQPDAESILVDGNRLGRVIEEAAVRHRSPLAFPIIDLGVEKAGLVRRFGVHDVDAPAFLFPGAPSREDRERYFHHLRGAAPSVRVAAVLGALEHIARQPGLVAIGATIGPFTLATRLMGDATAAIQLAAGGATADDEPAVDLLACGLDLSLAYILRYVNLQIAAGARAIVVTEPAVAAGCFPPGRATGLEEAFDRFVLVPNQRIADRLADHGVDLILHCGSELAEGMLEELCSFQPAMLGLGSSRRLWEDARVVPRDVVLYGNLPSDLFHSDGLMPVDRVATIAADLAARMEEIRHPFILGTESDTMHVEGAAHMIRSKVEAMLRAA
jgi:uroporphyrinogen-III decarboxylase